MARCKKYRALSRALPLSSARHVRTDDELADRKLAPTERRVMGYVRRALRFGAPGVYCNYFEWQRLAGVRCGKSIQRALERLERDGLVRVVRTIRVDAELAERLGLPPDASLRDARVVMLGDRCAQPRRRKPSRVARRLPPARGPAQGSALPTPALIAHQELQDALCSAGFAELARTVARRRSSVRRLADDGA